MDKSKRGAVFYLKSKQASAPVSAMTKAHRIALVDDLNRLSGPPSCAMWTAQQEFIDDKMDAGDTVAFAKVCYGLLAAAVSVFPAQAGRVTGRGASIVDFADAVAPEGKLVLMMRSIESRQNLIDRYNEAVGAPGPQVTGLQKQFLGDTLDPTVVAQYVQQCENMIAARDSLRRKKIVSIRTVAPLADASQPALRSGRHISLFA